MSACTYCGSARCEGDCDMGEEEDEIEDGEPDEPDFDEDAADNEADRHFHEGQE